MATGLKLTRHLVHTIFKIFDVDHDDQLSYKEFIGIMKDRLHRGSRVTKRELAMFSFKFGLREYGGLWLVCFFFLVTSEEIHSSVQYTAHCL